LLVDAFVEDALQEIEVLFHGLVFMWVPDGRAGAGGRPYRMEGLRV